MNNNSSNCKMIKIFGNKSVPMTYYAGSKHPWKRQRLYIQRFLCLLGLTNTYLTNFNFLLDCDTNYERNKQIAMHIGSIIN